MIDLWLFYESSFCESYKCDLCRTVKPDRHTADTHSGGSIPGHLANSPFAVIELFAFKLVTDQGCSLFQSDLTAMSMSAKI